MFLFKAPVLRYIPGRAPLSPLSLTSRMHCFISESFSQGYWKCERSQNCAAQTCVWQRMSNRYESQTVLSASVFFLDTINPLLCSFLKCICTVFQLVLPEWLAWNDQSNTHAKETTTAPLKMLTDTDLRWMVWRLEHSSEGRKLVNRNLELIWQIVTGTRDTCRSHTLKIHNFPSKQRSAHTWWAHVLCNFKCISRILFPCFVQLICVLLLSFCQFPMV